MDLGAIQVWTIVLAVFPTAFLAGRLRRLLGNRLLLFVTAGGLGLLRLSIQIWWGEPLVNLSLAMVGTALFILFLPACLWNAQLHGRLGIGHLGLGLLAGLILDTTIHGAFGTYDISWQVGLLTVLLTLSLVVVQWILLTSMSLARNLDIAGTPTNAADGRPIVKLLPWVAVGPFLFLQLAIFQNIARVAVLTGWPLPMAFGWTLLAQLAGLAAAAWVVSRTSRTLWPLALFSGLGLIAILALSYPQTTALTAILLLVGQILLSLLIALVFIGIGVSVQKMGFSGIVVANGLGMILLLLFLIGYYVGYYVSFPYSATLLEPVAAFIVAACALGASIGLRQRRRANHRAWLVPLLALPLLILPLVGAVTWRAPTAVSGEGFPVRIMTYNLHNGFNTDGYLGMEAIAQVIENSHPDVVALQEVSRGWVISGRLDMLTWLSQRLHLPYVFAPTADPFWGNAILSRYPIIDCTQYDLPPRDLPVLRGFVVAQIDVGNGDRLQVITTHFHHIEGETNIRQLQSEAILDFWDGAGSTVLLGDLNAQPHHPEMEMLRHAGLIDAMVGIEPPAYTHPSVNPDQRIDYIWVSPDLEVNNAWVPLSNASDHLPVVAEIGH
jgi:endonuclease/exonuclease/phosphatase family metal-dependent hydrolase